MGWHIVVTEEMRALGLSGNDLMVFALIYGFSQDGQGCFHGSLNYICETCGVSKSTTLRILQDLTQRGFIIKKEIYENGVKSVSYRSGIKMTPVVSKCNGGGVKMTPNNIIDNKSISNDIDDSNKRKAKFVKPTIEEIRCFCEERNNGIDADEFFNFYESKGWVIGKSPMKDWKACIRTWERNKFKSQRPTGRKVSVLENNMMVAEEIKRMAMNMGGGTT